jgi:disulfide bond formation protein DsbB
VKSFIRYKLWASFGVSTVATAVSLFWSFGLDWLPCDLCWYERICMYPVAVVTGVALMAKDDGYRRYVLPLSVVGTIVSFYHYLLQMVPSLNTSTGCTSIVSCAVPEFRILGFVTPPLLAFFAFVLLLAVNLPGAWSRSGRSGRRDVRLAGEGADDKRDH